MTESRAAYTRGIAYEGRYWQIYSPIAGTWQVRTANEEAIVQCYRTGLYCQDCGRRDCVHAGIIRRVI